MRSLRILLALTLALTTSCTGQPGSTTLDQQTSNTSVAGESPCPTEGDDLETAKLYIEHNATDEDTGVHGLFGGAAWSELCIWSPEGELLMVADPRNSLNDLTVSDLFFESREPPNAEFTLDDLRAAFPEGQYTVGARDFEGVARVGTATFTHAIPAPPKITRPALAADEEAASEASTTTAGFVVTWDAVTATIEGESLDITGYEVILTNVDREDPNGWSQPVYDVHVGPDATELEVPESFFEPGQIYELEVLAIEASGNQTITVGFFATE